MIKVKRIYEPSSLKDGYRILVDRLWPRGISKEASQLDLWLKDIAPSTELRKWYNHEIEKWPEFRDRYRKELQKNREIITELKKIVKTHQDVTFLYAAKDRLHNEAIVLKNYLKTTSK